MLFQTQGDLIVVLGIAAAILLALAIAGGVIAALKAFQVRQFQDLLFKAERKIDSLERRMFDVLNAVPVALVETDNTGKFTFANKAAHLLLGRKDSELIGLRFHSATWGITYPDGRMVPPDLMPIARTLRGQTVKGFQHLLTNHGSHDKILVSVTSMPIVNRAGEVTGTSAALVELETQAGQGIDDLTGLWRGQWFAEATVAFWGIDAEGQILDVNAAALEAFGMRREDALGKNWAQALVDDADFRNAIDYLAQALDSSEPHAHTSVRLTLKDRDGEALTSVVTAWMVRTHEGGERGLTVMAMPGAVAD
ncbi:MAG: PAS domain-containing protein, partial [Asticcacaulis sp.]